MYNFVALASLLVPAVFAEVSLKDKRLCRGCGELGKIVEARLAKTAANPRVIEVAGRIGPDGRPIPSRKIDYLNSEARYLDIFNDICEEANYSAKSGCYAIVNDHDEALREWFLNKRGEPFAESFCYKELPNCTHEVHEASLTDIELENYEEDKDKIDPDFMPEASEEAVKKEKENKVIERAKDIRDNILDTWEHVDLRAQKWLLAQVIGHPVLEPYLVKLLAREHIDTLATYWYLFLISAFFTAIVPVLILARMSRRRSGHKNANKAVPKIKEKNSSRKAAVVPESESEAVDADDEKSEEAEPVEVVKKAVRGRAASSKTVKESPSPTRTSSKSPAKSAYKSPAKRTSTRRA